MALIRLAHPRIGQALRIVDAPNPGIGSERGRLGRVRYCESGSDWLASKPIA